MEAGEPVHMFHLSTLEQVRNFISPFKTRVPIKFSSACLTVSSLQPNQSTKFPLRHTCSFSMRIKCSERLFTWDRLGNVFILVAIVMNTASCAIAVIAHFKRVVLSNSSNTIAM